MIGGQLTLSASDARLAHGLVRSAVLAAVDAVPKVAGTILKAKRMDTFLAAVARHFRWRMVSVTHTAKTYGSRARCTAFVLEPHEDGGDYGLMCFRWTGTFPHVQVTSYGVTVRRHAVARWLQRSGGGTVDVDAAVGGLWPYLLAGMEVDASSFAVSGPEGETRFSKPGRGKLCLETWIGVERATPELTVRVVEPAAKAAANQQLKEQKQ